MAEETNEDQPITDPKRKRSWSKSSIGHSIRSSKTKFDEFLKSQRLGFGKRKRYTVTEEENRNSQLDLNSSEEPPRKKFALPRLNASSLASPVKKVGDILQKSLSISSVKSPQPSKFHPSAPYRKPSAASKKSVKHHLSSYWRETVDNSEVERLDKHQIDRQEAIFELYKSEIGLINDLAMIKSAYHDSLKKLGLLTDAELGQIFGQIDHLIPIHQELVDALNDQRNPDGTMENVGKVLTKWVPRLHSSYSSYCANQIYAKDLLDAKKRDPAVEDFLQRCLESPFSRRLDLWSFLDVPRSRLVKYPLLFKSIQKHTAATHEDHALIDQALEIVETAIKDVDLKIGESKCRFFVEKLEFLDDHQKHPLIFESQSIVCDGLLKTGRGMKLHVFLFDKILVLTRRSSRGDETVYQVYHRPIPLSLLAVQDMADERTSQKGSFKNAFTQSQQTIGHSFQVLNMKDASLQSYVLQAYDERDRQHWLQSLSTAIEASSATAEDSSVLAGSSIGFGSSFPYRDEPYGLDDRCSWAGSVSSLTSALVSTEIDETEDPLVP